MKIAERIVIVLLLFIIILGFAWIYFAVQFKQQEVKEGVARGDYNIPIETKESEVTADDWQVIYPGTVPMTIGRTSLMASVADTIPERIKGLSGTPFLPDKVVKLFAFGAAGEQSIWMKNMNYPLDIIWLDKEGIIVHIEKDISPETYPDSFSSPAPAWYVIEANAGFTASNTVAVGDKVTLPKTR